MKENSCTQRLFIETNSLNFFSFQKNLPQLKLKYIKHLSLPKEFFLSKDILLVKDKFLIYHKILDLYILNNKTSQIINLHPYLDDVVDFNKVSYEELNHLQFPHYIDKVSYKAWIEVANKYSHLLKLGTVDKPHKLQDNERQNKFWLIREYDS